MTGQSSASVPLYAPVSSSCSSFVPFFFVPWSLSQYSVYPLFFSDFSLFFICMLCLNSGTKPKLGLALCFLPFVHSALFLLPFFFVPVLSSVFFFPSLSALGLSLVCFAFLFVSFASLSLSSVLLLFSLGLSFSGFYSQRTIRFFQPLIAGVMVAVGVR